MVRTVKRALLKASILSSVMAVAIALGISVPFLRVAAPWIFSGAFLFDFFSDRFEKPVKKKLEEFQISSVFSDQEFSGLDQMLRRFRKKASDLYYLSLISKIIFLGCAGSLLHLAGYVNIPWAIVVGYGAFGLWTFAGVRLGFLSLAFSKFRDDHGKELTRREEVRRQLAELQPCTNTN
jgi:hypothetical protein